MLGGEGETWAMKPQGKGLHDTTGHEERGWLVRYRDGLLLALGASMLIGETGAAIFGHPADPLIVGSAVALISGREILQKRSAD